MTREMTYAAAILEGTDQAMASDPNVYVMGLGVPDPKGIFGTTMGLDEKYPDRVMDMPTSENAMTGVAIGSAVQGMRPILTHQRVDFALLSLDQIINNASKWHYMFGNQMRVPLVIRLVIGRGWGQGPQHSQTLHGLFAHIPGLKVVMPSTPYDAKGLLNAAIEDDNPVIYLEHRWLHNIYGEVPEEKYSIPLGKAKVVTPGTDVTIVASSHMTLEAYKAIQMVPDVSVELVDLRSIRPLDKETIIRSVQKTGRLIVADPDWRFGGFAGEIISIVAEEAISSLVCPPTRVCYPDRLSPSSPALAKHFYPTDRDIARTICHMMEIEPTTIGASESEELMDVPDKSFTGPF